MFIEPKESLTKLAQATLPPGPRGLKQFFLYEHKNLAINNKKILWWVVQEYGNKRKQAASHKVVELRKTAKECTKCILSP